MSVSALAAEWIEILYSLSIALVLGSPPSRRSGLKYYNSDDKVAKDYVSALAAEWIEISR